MEEFSTISYNEKTPDEPALSFAMCFVYFRFLRCTMAQNLPMKKVAAPTVRHLLGLRL